MTRVTLIDSPEAEAAGIPRRMTSLGVEFIRGKSREVPDHLVDKFQGNASFDVEGRPYLVSKHATVGGQEAAYPLIDEADVVEADVVGKDEGFTADQLLHVLDKRKVKVKKADASDPDALMALVEANGGEPTEEELADYTPAE